MISTILRDSFEEALAKIQHKDKTINNLIENIWYLLDDPVIEFYVDDLLGVDGELKKLVGPEENGLNNRNVLTNVLAYIFKISTKKIKDKLNETENESKRLKESNEKTENKIVELLQDKIKAEDEIKRLNQGKSDIILHTRFEDVSKTLNEKNYIYRIFAIGLAVGLGVVYLGFFCWNILSIDYEKHLMLIAVCSPLIFLDIWLFYQVGHMSKLADEYAYKAALAYTIKEGRSFIFDKEIGERFDFIYQNLFNNPVACKNASFDKCLEYAKKIKELAPVVGIGAKE